MNYYTSFQLNIFAVILLVILLISIFVKRETYKESARILTLLTVTIILLLLLEMLSWTFDGIDEGYAYILNYIFNLFFFITGIFAAGLFASYIDYMNFESKERLRRRFYYMHMAVFAVILININFFTPIIFSISADNVYSREPFMVLGFLSVYILLLHMLVQTFRNRKNMDKPVVYTMYTFILLPFIGGVLQLFFFGLLIMWALSGLGILIAYIFNETISNSRDYLTKLYTREITYAYMKTMTENNQLFIVIILDIDDFKNINDSFGHKAGDEVLIHFSRILTDTFDKTALVSRFGGDEFVVVLKESTKEEVVAYYNLLKSKLTLYKGKKYIKNIKFSYGYSFREIDSSISIDELLDEADKLMYSQKAEHKNYRRRLSDK